MSDLQAAATLITGIGSYVTAPPGSGPLRGAQMSDVLTVHGAAIAADADGRIIAAGPERAVMDHVRETSDTCVIDAAGALVIPGLVDCHAHPVFGGDRAAEFELRNLGADYEQVHAAGGGIRSTVAHTRASIADGSIDGAIHHHLEWMLRAGTTTTEGKSGYALTFDDELASLDALHRAASALPISVTGTVLAAHTVPGEYAGRADAYIDEVAIPAVREAAHRGLATAADVFLERGSFDAVQSERYLRAARAAGLDIRLHGDQFSNAGSVSLAIELGARSIDHLEALEPSAARLTALAASDVAAVLLPLSSLVLDRPYAPGRALIDAGSIVALASDFNPGSSYGESLTLAMSLACAGCKLRASEALVACTANAAWILRAEHAGRIDVGRSCDLVLLDQPSLAHLPYHVGSPGITGVIVRGRHIGHDSA